MGVFHCPRCPAVSQVTGLPPDPLRPDVFGKPVTSPTGLAEAQAPFSLEARSLGLNPAAIAATALKKAIGDKKARRWAEGNFEAIEAHNRYVEQHGLPLDKYRMF